MCKTIGRKWQQRRLGKNHQHDQDSDVFSCRIPAVSDCSWELFGPLDLGVCIHVYILYSTWWGKKLCTLGRLGDHLPSRVIVLVLGRICKVNIQHVKLSFVIWNHNFSNSKEDDKRLLTIFSHSDFQENEVKWQDTIYSTSLVTQSMKLGTTQPTKNQTHSVSYCSPHKLRNSKMFGSFWSFPSGSGITLILFDPTTWAIELYCAYM